MLKSNEKPFIFCGDIGGNYSKYKTKDTRKTISSRKGIITHSFNLQRDFREDDYLVELDGKKYGVAGLSEESRMPLRMFSQGKQNLYYDISLLLGIHLYGSYSNYVSMLIPVDSMSEQERDGLYSRLVREWALTVNGVYREFVISDLKLFPEGVTGFFNQRPIGKTRWVDLGSRTLNWGTVINDQNGVRFINAESGTLYNTGLEAVGVELNNYAGGEEIAHYAAGNLLSVWNPNDNVNLLGGGAQNKGFVDGFKSYFPNATVVPNPRSAAIDGLFEVSQEVFAHAKR